MADAGVERDLQQALIELNEAVLAISAERDLDDVLQAVVDRAREFAGARYAALGMVDPDSEQLERFVFSGMSEAQVRRVGRLPEGRGVLGVVLRAGEALRLDDIRDHPASVGFPEGHPSMRSFLGVPITQGEQVLGNLYLSEKLDAPAFSADDEELLVLFARHAALAIVNSRLLARVASSERRYRLLTEGAPEIVFALDHTGRVTFVNARLEPLTGITPDELIGRPLRMLAAGEDRAVVDMHLRAMRGGVERAAFAMRTRDAKGARRYFEISLVSDGQGNGFQGIAQDVTERRAMARDMAERTRELLSTREERERLRELVSVVIQAQEDERARIAGDLHDTTVQTLTAIGRRLRSLAEGRAGDESLGEELGMLAAAALDEAEEVRRLSRNLRPSVLDHLGLAAALEHLAAEVRADGRSVDVSVEGAAGQLGDRERTTLFRVAQEALRNVRRHSDATEVDVTLDVAPTCATLTVRDNGCGFAPEVVGTGLGLAGMRERAAIMGGRLEVESAPGAGCRLTVALPLDR